MSITSLPTELIESIAHHLDVATSQSLRLVSSTFEQQSLHVFRDRFFRARILQWTKASFDKLLDITAHPTFGKALRWLHIDATPRHAIALWQLRKRISEAEVISNDPNGILFRSEMQEQYIADEKVAQNQTTFFNETRYDQKCLRSVFEKLGQLDGLTFAYEGMDKKYGKFGRRYCESSQHEMSRPFVSTMAAIAASGVRIKTIKMHPTLTHGAVGIGRLESLAPSLRKFDIAFEHLNTLELELRDWRHLDTGFELETTRAPFVVRFLAKARNLRHLSLGCYSSFDDDLLGDMARHCTFARLETCTLKYFRPHDAFDLFLFLKPSNSTLRALSLQHICLRGHGVVWWDVFAQMISSPDMLPNLETLHLFKLWARSGVRSWQNESLGTPGNKQLWKDELFWYEVDVDERAGPPWHLASVAYPFIGMRT
ncbi:hypothetical protein FB567DRAFT_587955 [Paraphoma chrysanthemicola]|uniref:F-box domain-containing protein n=1 Tax=Paraphoma chrysanthemicola TaxID=798071 RepID=A0A8K0RGB1_9PLEO|nr:hypothetical protein FB567DRAFT_587955 [Paraphoma chrysanthemicola]